jgi:voltage-gated potassium channel
MPGGRLERRRRVRGRVEQRAASAVANRRAFGFLALVTAALGISVGFVMHAIDKQDFHSYGDGIWWAVVTLGTVGYGDIVPHTGWGRLLGAIVIVTGVTFIAFLTAIVTSIFVTNDLELREAEDAGDGQDALARIEERLTAMEAELARIAEAVRR